MNKQAIHSPVLGFLLLPIASLGLTSLQHRGYRFCRLLFLLSSSVTIAGLVGYTAHATPAVDPSAVSADATSTTAEEGRRDTAKPLGERSPNSLSSVDPSEPIVLAQAVADQAFTDDCLAACNPTALFTFRSPIASSPAMGAGAYDVGLLAPTATAAPVATRPVLVPYSAPAPLLGQATPTPTTSAQGLAPTPAIATPAPPLTSASQGPVTEPTLRLQGTYIYQADDSSARLRLYGVYPLTPRIQAGGSIDLTDGVAFSDSEDEGISINELYLTFAPEDLPNLRFVVGQLDLTSYFDRNSFAKDAARDFFNSTFHTNPALSATAIASRPSALVNWAVTDTINAQAAVFSSDPSLSDFELNGFAGEVGVRLGNAVVRGTYVSAIDGGADTSFGEIFGIDRGNGEFGVLSGDREDAYGVNAELFIPELNMGIFGRYGRYENHSADRGADTYSAGVTFYDLFAEGDRIGLAYGRGLSNAQLRQDSDDDYPDVLELYYDTEILPNLRLGFSVQQLDEFSETVAGVRLRTEFDVVPRDVR